MIQTYKKIEEVHRRYAQSDRVFDLIFGHCKIVTEIAEWCVNNKKLKVNKDILIASCLLHDIGSYALFDADGLDNNEHNYKQHAIFGAALAIEEGFDEQIAECIKTHTLMGLTKSEIIKHGFGMPQNNYEPASIEARLLCYADRFHSKQPIFNDYKSFLARLKDNLPEQAEKLEQAAEEFGVPDIKVLAKKYKQPIRT